MMTTNYWVPTPEEARRYLSLHKQSIRDYCEGMTDDEVVEWFLRVNETHPMEIEDGIIFIEISGSDSITGNPIIFELDRS
jgi:hypothetical protein